MNRSFRAAIPAGDPSLYLWTLGWDLHTLTSHPTWLLTGDYNPATHRAAVEGVTSISSEMRAAMERRTTPMSNPPIEPFRQN